MFKTAPHLACRMANFFSQVRCIRSISSFSLKHNDTQKKNKQQQTAVMLINFIFKKQRGNKKYSSKDLSESYSGLCCCTCVTHIER